MTQKIQGSNPTSCTMLYAEIKFNLLNHYQNETEKLSKVFRRVSSCTTPWRYRML